MTYGPGTNLQLNWIWNPYTMYTPEPKTDLYGGMIIIKEFFRTAMTTGPP